MRTDPWLIAGVALLAAAAGAAAMLAWCAFDTWREIHEPPPSHIDWSNP